MKKEITVSAVVPVYNNERFIKKHLLSLLNQSRKFDEIIVVDDGSNDSTLEIVRKMNVRVIELKKNKGQSFARNLGLKKSKGEIVFFAESDAVYDNDFLSESLKHFKDKKVAGVIGKQAVWNENESIWTKCKAAERKATFENYKAFSVWLYRRDVIEKAGIFDETLRFGEDVDLAKRVQKLGFELVYEPKALWFHREPVKLSELIKRQWKFGLGINKFYKKNGYPKMILFDALFFLFIILSFFNYLLLIYPLLFITGKIIVSIKMFKFIQKKYLFHLIIFILIPSIVFKIGRITGLIKGLIK